jgi:copper chaperone NosL
MNNKISVWSRILLIISSALLVVAIFVPLWQIELSAPQYPEGLGLKIYPDKIGGDVDIINGLNHYIGMKTLHAEDFIEFSVLVYIIGFYAILALMVATVGYKKVLYTVFTLFVLFGIVAMVDFWRWEYNYGHDLDPHAAIIVPGMAYQPPLIGYKQLLNFGAYSVPDVGGWLFIGSGLLMLIAVIKESTIFKKKKIKNINLAISLLALVLFSSCSSSGPEKINLNKDDCHNCKMSISDKRFACEIVTEKGRAYKFDDITCLMSFKKENQDKMANAIFYINNYLSPNDLLLSTNLTFVEGKHIGSPMGGNVASFTNKDSANVYLNIWDAKLISWNEIK